jgi:hypothetical protein
LAREYRQLRLDEPAVVLTCGRSGSTLLRVILDSHPELACPPETGLIGLCTQMGVASMRLDGPTAGERHTPSELGLRSIRAWVATNFGAYLVEAGKVRWCEKSLGSAQSASRFLLLFPKAKFICLYRHGMDVIDSVHEACPWGLTGYGLDPFGVAHPGNSVAAVADYWATHTQMIRTFEEENPEVCLRLRYEDLVADPQAQADRLFEFLDEEPVPGLASMLLDQELEQFGPSDHKIWETGNIHDNSVGRGHRIPASAIPPQILDMVNRLLAELDYEQVGPGWGRSGGAVIANGHAAPVDGADTVAEVTGTRDGSRAAVVQAAAMATLESLEVLLASQIARRSSVTAQVPGAVAGQRAPFQLTAAAPALDGSDPVVRSWLVDPVGGQLTAAANPGEEPMSDTVGWQVSGLAMTWVNVLTGQLGLATALRRRLLRLSQTRPDETDDDVSEIDEAARTGTLYRLFGRRQQSDLSQRIEYAKERS